MDGMIDGIINEYHSNDLVFITFLMELRKRIKKNTVTV